MQKSRDKINKKKQVSFEEKLYSFFIPVTSHFQSKAFDKKLSQADIDLDSDVYLSKYLFYATLVFLLVVVLGGIFAYVTNITSIFTLFFIGIISFFGIIVYAFLNPYIIIGEKVTSIKNNLPLAILGMSSIAESGAPPEAIFNVSSIKQESPFVYKEFLKINYYLDNLGISLLEAIDIVAKKTPSFELRKFLFELKSNIESGGSLSEFMKKKADHAQFEYHLLLSKLNKKAETFGDIYSAVVISGPLFLFSGVMLLGMVGSGSIAGFSISTILTLGIFGLIPVVNIIFYLILNMFS